VEPCTVSASLAMLSRILRHARTNAVGYVALLAALGGTSYASVRLAPGTVTTRALANRAVTNAKLARNAIDGSNLRNHSLTPVDFRPGVLAQAVKRALPTKGRAGPTGPMGPMGPKGPAGKNGSGNVVVAARGTGVVGAPHGTSTDVPLTGGSWTQAANDLNLITGSMSVKIPSACTGSFGNALVVSVDGVPNTFALAPTAPASGTVTVPFVVSDLMEQASSTSHTITTKLTNSCTKSGEDYAISNVKIDVVTFH
jgi:hypothetical protein